MIISDEIKNKPEPIIEELLSEYTDEITNIINCPFIVFATCSGCGFFGNIASDSACPLCGEKLNTKD